MAEKIFLSYAFRDRHLVDAVERALREHKIVTSEDVIITEKELSAGENIRAKVREQISSASKVVIVASNEGAVSPWVNYEAGMATALGKPIVIIGRKGVGKSALIRSLENVKFIEI
jgi:putative ribosome biogenesis GTPase RsgA